MKVSFFLCKDNKKGGELVEKSIDMDDKYVRSFMPVGMLGPQFRRKRRSLITAQGGDQ